MVLQLHHCTTVELVKRGAIMYKIVREKPMKEIVYRESRIARVLGEPAKYAITNLLLRHGPLNGMEIAKRVRRSRSTVSHHLNALRSLDIVRYEVRNDGVYYWIKYPKELRVIINSLKAFVKRTKQRLASDT
jgi:DNA-binding transcriptional ArsR family regulator